VDEHVSHATEHPDLKRGIGPYLLLFFVLGDIVGAGIYALVGEVGAAVGGAIWSAFLFAFVLAIFTASSYAELAPSTRGPVVRRPTSTTLSSRLS
jgi:basic amino acid/polyamine antiporter, APA family